MPSAAPSSPFAYQSPYSPDPPPQYFPAFSYPDHFHLEDFSDQKQFMSQSMQPPPSPSTSSIPIDPALSLYPPYYPGYQQHPPHIPQHLTLPPNYSSPSSQGSDTIGTPPTEHMYPKGSSNMNGKRPAPSSAMVDNRKKARKDEGSEAGSPMAEKDEVKAKPTRGSRACTVCRRLKMKCVGAEHGPPCKRCQTGNHECIFEESNRGKRSSKKHEILTRSLRKMERTLDTVLRSIGNPSITSGMISRSPSPSAQNSGTHALLDRTPSPEPSSSTSRHHTSNQQQVPSSPKLHSLPDNSLNPLGLLAEASLANRRAHVGRADRPTKPDDTPQMGVASDNYFKPGPMTILPLRRLYIERQIQPEMLTFVSTEEVVALFNIYFDHVNMHCNLLDRSFHTPSLVCSRSPFLLTTICSIASKFYTEKPDLHPQLTELAKRLAFSVPAKGYKSVEIVQAYLLLALWGCGAVERYEQDKTWLLLGMAIRMATDLNLHRKTAVSSQDTQEGKARDIEVHNRERTWILCFCLDRSFSAQMGKPSTVKEDYIIRHTRDWSSSPAACASDVSLGAYAELQRMLSRSLEFLYSGTDSLSGLQQNCDYLLIIKTFESQLLDWREQWMTRGSWEAEAPPVAQYKAMISRFYFNYATLVINSFGLQNAMESSPTNIGYFFARVHTAANACATIVRDELGPSGYMKYSPDSHFVQTSYAVLTLLKLVRVEFQPFLDNEQSVVDLVKDVADTLENLAANSLHTPALYSGFLRALISAKLDPAPSRDEKQPSPDREQSNDGQQGGSRTPASGSFGQHMSGYGQQEYMNEFQFDSEMGPVADISTFPPTMAPNPSETTMGSLTMENILSSSFWDSMLVPGFNSMDGLSGGFVFGAGGSGLITPRFGGSPMQSGACTPGGHVANPSPITQTNINAAFDHRRKEGLAT